MKEISIGIHHFKTKTSATIFIKNIIVNYQIGEELGEEDKKFFLALFVMHEDYPEKLQPGVIKIKFKTQKFGTKGLQIYKSDGTDDDISWHNCLNSCK